jgi:hypothetical protein
VISFLLLVAACGEERREPPRWDGACAAIPKLVCEREFRVTASSADDPLLGLCAPTVSGNFPGGYVYGSAEGWLLYDDDGTLTGIDMNCGEDVHMRARRDEEGRIIRWEADAIFDPREVLYDTDGRVLGWHEWLSDTVVRYDERSLVTSVTTSYGSYDPARTTELSYDDESRLTRMWDWRGEVRIAYFADGDGRDVRAVSGPWGSTSFLADPDYLTVTYLGLSFDPTATIVTRYDGSGGSLEVDYTHLVIERDLGPDPYQTVWLDYDDEGRLSHIKAWGHIYGEIR